MSPKKPIQARQAVTWPNNCLPKENLVNVTKVSPRKRLLNDYQTLAHQIDQGLEHVVGHGNDPGRGFVSALVN